MCGNGQTISQNLAKITKSALRQLRFRRLPDIRRLDCTPAREPDSNLLLQLHLVDPEMLTMPSTPFRVVWRREA